MDEQPEVWSSTRATNTVWKSRLDDMAENFVRGIGRGAAILTCLWIASYLFPHALDRLSACIQAAALN